MLAASVLESFTSRQSRRAARTRKAAGRCGARRAFLLGLTLGLGSAADAWALDKQGSAHGGKVGGEQSGVAISGSALAGIAIYNPTYAARPDNTGRAFLRYAAHFDADLLGRLLSIPLDLNFFTDRERRGINKLVPSEFDVITGLTSTLALAPSAALELGARIERDMPVDRSGQSQSYADVRTRLLTSLAAANAAVSNALAGGDVSAVATLGWFFWNPTYAARPDNSGRALFRYALGVQAVYGRFGAGIDGTFFTDRRENAVRPSELDATGDISFRPGPLELHLAYERDMPIDRGGLVQQLLLLSVSGSFEIWSTATEEAPRSHGPGANIER